MVLKINSMEISNITGSNLPSAFILKVHVAFELEKLL